MALLLLTDIFNNAVAVSINQIDYVARETHSFSNNTTAEVTYVYGKKANENGLPQVLAIVEDSIADIADQLEDTPAITLTAKFSPAGKTYGAIIPVENIVTANETIYHDKSTYSVIRSIGSSRHAALNVKETPKEIVEKVKSALSPRRSA